jgi:Fe-S cluster assembly scaffold protein SufB
LNIFIKNNCKKSYFIGKIIAQNYSELKIEKFGNHKESDTIIKIDTKVIAHKDSISKLLGTAKIDKNIKNCDSDIKFSALADKSAQIEFLPAQLISSVPQSADHSASIYKAINTQIEFLKESGLSTTEVKKVLEEAFINNFDLF